MFRLCISRPDGSIFEHELDAPSVVVGRSSSCDLNLPDPSLSRRHARIFNRDDQWLVEDLGSRNGTVVNGRLIDRPTRLRTGDVLHLSASRIELLAPDAELPSTTTPIGWEPVYRNAASLRERVNTPPPSEAPQAMLLRFSERLRMLNEIHTALGHSLALDELLDLILDRAFSHLRPQQGAIFLRDAGGGFYQARSRALPSFASDFVYSENLLQQVTEGKVAAVVVDTHADSRFHTSESLRAAGVRSILAVPLLGMDPEEPAQGMIALSTLSMIRQFTEEDLELLVSLASVAAMRLRNVSLAEEAAERRRLERELAIARSIQVQLFPKQLPTIAGYELHAGTRPSAGVSGDFYSLDCTADGRCVIQVVDVSGKGIGASLLAGYIEAQLSCYVDEGLAPHEVFAKVSGRLHQRSRPESFATAFLGMLDPVDGTTSFANAGHTPPFIIDASGGVRRLPSTGFPLGLFAAGSYTPAAVRLAAGDLLVLHTDGITEVENREGLELGIDRLAELCRNFRDLPLATIAANIDRDVLLFAGDHTIFDDRTLVLVRRCRDAS